MTSTAGAAIDGGAGLTTSTTGGAGLTSAAGGAPCGACAIATIDIAANTTASRVLTSNHRFFILLPYKSLQFPVVLDARPCALGPAVHGGRLELAYSKPGSGGFIEAPVAGRALDLAFQHLAVDVDPEGQRHQAGFVGAYRGGRVSWLRAGGRVHDSRSPCRHPRRRDRHRGRRRHHRRDRRWQLHRN